MARLFVEALAIVDPRSAATLPPMCGGCRDLSIAYGGRSDHDVDDALGVA